MTRSRWLFSLLLLLAVGGAGTAYAGSTTPNLGLYKPSVSETGWGGLVNANWDTLDLVPQISGAITPGNCAQWVTAKTLGQATLPCGSGGGGGITSLNGLSGAAQTFANDTNVTVSSSGTVHTITWASTLAVARGGTGVSDFSFSGSTHKALTITGAQVNGNCLKSDGSNNAIDSGVACGTGSMAIGGTVTSGTASSLLYVGAGPVLSQVSITGLVLGNGASAPSAYPGGTCTSQAVTAISAAGVVTCNSIADAYLTGAVGVPHGGTGLTTFAANQVPVATGVNVLAATTLPSCSNSTTSKLLYDNSAHTFSCGTDQNTANVYTLATKTTNYTVTTSDKVILCDATGGTVTLTLPAASTQGLYFIVKKIDSSSNACTIARAGADTIDGATSLSTSVRYDAYSIVADGSTSWSIF